MMKAWVLSQYGSVKQLELRAIAKPVPKPGEVLVKVYATTVNDWDWCLMRGPFYIRLFYGLLKPKVTILGTEVAGRVEATGEKVTRFQLGDAVYGDLSDCGFGGFADYVCVPETALTPKPEAMSFTEAAALPHAAALALQGLQSAKPLRPEMSLLVNGAGGGVGTLAVQIARAAGVTQITGVDSASKADLMRTVGFTHTLDYTKTDFTAGTQRYDLILDTKTNRFPLRYLRVLKPGGTYMTVGGAIPNLLQILLLAPFVRQWTKKNLRIVALQPNKDLGTVHDLFAAGKLKPWIDGPYPMSQIPERVQYFGRGQHQGKVVLDWASDR